MLFHLIVKFEWMLAACCLHNLCANVNLINLIVYVWSVSGYVSPVPQPPTITLQSPKDYIFDPRENIVIHCEAKGKPHPRWDVGSSHSIDACLFEHVHQSKNTITCYTSVLRLLGIKVLNYMYSNDCNCVFVCMYVQNTNTPAYNES